MRFILLCALRCKGLVHDGDVSAGVLTSDLKGSHYPPSEFLCILVLWLNMFSQSTNMLMPKLSGISCVRAPIRESPTQELEEPTAMLILQQRRGGESGLGSVQMCTTRSLALLLP